MGGLFGGSKAKPYQSGQVGQYENDIYGEIKKRMANPMEGASGVAKATSGYNFSPVNQAISGTAANTYNPFQFNFGQMPEEATRIGYAEGSKQIQREGDDALKKAQQTIGSRRPGLLYKAAESVGRDTTSNLAGLNNQLQLNKINQNLQLGKEQQQSQAAENQGASRLRNDQLSQLAQLALGQIGSQSGLLGQERAYALEPAQLLQQLYGAAGGITNQGAQVAQQGKSSALGFLGNLI